MTVEKGELPDSPSEPNTTAAPETPVAAAPAPDASAAPSPAKDESVLDRVKAALKPKTEGSSPSTASQEAAPSPQASSEDDEKEPDSDPTEEEKARYHSKTRKQINRLLVQRNEALDKIKSLEPEVEGFRRITGFIADAGMTPDEANLLLEIGRNMKKDPLKAWEQLKPYVAQLQRLAGDELPPDLQEAVTKGEIADAYARQLARARTETAVHSTRARESDAALQQRNAAQASQQVADAMASTISTWERSQAQSDPDWNLKQSRIGELIELEVLRTKKYPRTAQEAIDLAEKAKTAVNAEFARLQPRKPAVAAVNPASAARVQPAKPTTALEAARQALAASG
jgi:hypothetical protein